MLIVEQRIIDHFLLKRCQKKRPMIFFKTLYQNVYFLGNGRPSKIRLLQSYEVLWIHVNDAICKSDFPIEIGWRKARENSCGSESF